MIPTTTTKDESARQERNLILMVGLIQFVNILDFMMVMPLGPDFARDLGIPASDIGLIGGSYTFAAAISGLSAAFFLDRFPRKKAVLFFLAGLIVATLGGAVAWDKGSMVAVRLLAGLFGGPLTALSQALIADTIPPERRGSAMGKVAGAFAAASVLGVPFGLELARRFSWHAPFVTTALLGVAVALLVWFRLPYHAPFAGTQNFRERARHLGSMLQSRAAATSYAFIGLTMMAGFMIIPNIAAHLQMNLGYPREKLGLLYLFGGLVSFFGVRIAGWLVDRTSSTVTVSLFSATLIFAILTGYVFFPSPVPVMAIFILFMMSMSGRMVAAQTLSSKIPAPQERGAYMSLQSATMHFSSAFGAYYSSLVLVVADGTLQNVPVVGWTAIGLSLLVPLLIWQVERHMPARKLAGPVVEAAVALE